MSETSLKRRIKNYLKKQLALVFHQGQRFRVDILPRHFYSEVPNMHKLRSTEDWRRPFSMCQVQGWDADEQLAFVESAMDDGARHILASRNVFAEACAANDATGYGPIEAEFLYAFVLKYRPERIIQIGCGISTAVCLAAAKDAGFQPQITCVDPFPTEFLVEADRKDQINLIAHPVESLELSFLTELSSGDLFFVDSTHTLGPAGEVTRIVLEVLPRLPRGVLIHFHDIWFPYDFDPRIMDRIFFWHETSLLQAFLCGNECCAVRASLSFLHYERVSDLRSLFPRYEPMQMERGVRVRDGHYPNSLYLEVIN